MILKNCRRSVLFSALLSISVGLTESFAENPEKKFSLWGNTSPNIDYLAISPDAKTLLGKKRTEGLDVSSQKKSQSLFLFPVDPKETSFKSVNDIDLPDTDNLKNGEIILSGFFNQDATKAIWHNYFMIKNTPHSYHLISLQQDEQDKNIFLNINPQGDTLVGASEPVSGKALILKLEDKVQNHEDHFKCQPLSCTLKILPDISLGKITSRFSTARAINSKGMVVGWALFKEEVLDEGYRKAVLWENTNLIFNDDLSGQITRQALPSHHDAAAFDLSDDGNIIVGWAIFNPSPYHSAALWKKQSHGNDYMIVPLPKIKGSHHYSEAIAVSHDGKTILVNAMDETEDENHAHPYTLSSAIVKLPDHPEVNQEIKVIQIENPRGTLNFGARAMSKNGQFVLGHSREASGKRLSAYILKMEDSLEETHLTQGRPQASEKQSPLAVSAPNRSREETKTGVHQQSDQQQTTEDKTQLHKLQNNPFVKYTKAKGTFIHLNNTYQGLFDTLSHQWQGIDLADDRLMGLFERRCEVSQGQSCIQVGASGRALKEAKGDSLHLNVTQSLVGGTYFGIVLDRSLGKGGSKQLEAHNIVPAMALYLGWEQNDLHRGWGLMAGVGYMKDHLNIKRAYQPHTEEGRGHSYLRGFSLITQASYTLQMNPGWDLSPYGEFRYSHFKRKAYSEDTHFKTEYDALEAEKYILRAGFNLNKSLDPVFSVSVGGGVSLILSQKAKGGQATLPELNDVLSSSKIEVPRHQAQNVSGFGQGQIQARLNNNVFIRLSGSIDRHTQIGSLTFSQYW